MRFVFAEHPPKPDATIFSVHEETLERAVAKVRHSLMWISKVGDRLYETIDRTVYQVYFNDEGMTLLWERYGVMLPPTHEGQPNMDRNPAYDGPVGVLEGYGEYDDPAEHDGARD